MNNEKRKITIGKPYIKKERDEVKLCASINWEDKEGTVWFSADTEYGEYLTDDRADAFAAGLLIMAMYADADIICQAPLTRRLRYQLNHYLIPMLAANLKGFHPVEIHAEVTDDILQCAGAVGMCRTDDVDSMYTLKEHLSIEEQDYRLTHLLVENHGMSAGAPELRVVRVGSNLCALWPKEFPEASTFRYASEVLALQKLFGVFYKPAMHEFSSFSFDEKDCSRYDLATLGCLETDTTVFYSAGGGKKRKKLSVVIPAYNAEKYLEEAVLSVKQQSWFGETEIIIIDDGSEDETLHIAKKLGNIVLTKKKGGAASARNAGIKAASGDFILLLDADDILTEGALERLYEPFCVHKELTAVFSKAEDFVSPELSDEAKKGLCVRKESYGGVLPGCSLIRKETFGKIGLFDGTLKTGETVAWQMKLRDAKLPVVSLDFVSMKRRLHMTNTGRRSARQEMADYAAILRKRLRK